MDVVSGAVHVVDEVCYDVISGICKLKEAGGLTLSDGQAVCAGCEADGGCRGKSEIPAEALKASGVLEKLGEELLDRYSETEIREALLEVIGLTEAGQLFVCLLYTSPSPRD